MLMEMHCHTREHSRCSHVDALSLIKEIYTRGVEGAVITDHHYVWTAEELQRLKEAAAAPDFFLLFSGQEVATSDLGHVLVYGPAESFPEGTAAAAIRARHPEAALVLAHPYRDGKRPSREHLHHPLLNAVEIFSSNHSVSDNAAALQDWHRYKFTAIAGTDTHGENYAALYPTLFDHKPSSLESLTEELKKGRCRPFFQSVARGRKIEEVAIGTRGEHEPPDKIVIKRIEDSAGWLSAQRAFYIMHEIGRREFDKGKYRVPRIAVGDETHRVVIEEGLHGKTLYDALHRANPGEAEQFISLAAEWLGRLHGLRIQITPPEEFMEREPDRLQGYVEQFERIGHVHTGRAREIMEAVLSAEKAVAAGMRDQLIQGHGDYHLKNIYIGYDDLRHPESIYVGAIDFNSSYCLPPAFDVGTFLSQYHHQLIGRPETHSAQADDIFVGSYLKTVRIVSPDFSRQVELFRARTNLSIASFLIRVGLGESEYLWRALVEAERELAQMEAG